jgi:hypothetical protein
MFGITNYEVGLYMFAAFLTIYGVLFLFFSKEAPSSPKKGIKAVFSPKLALFLFGLLYLSMAHFSVYSALGLNVEYGWDAPCENVVANSTDISATVTAYEYTDSCLSRTTPPISETVFTLFTWILWIDFFAIFVGALLLFAVGLGEW